MPKEDYRRTGRFDFKSDVPWRIFRIMAEFVEGFEFLSTFHKTVSIFGSTHPAVMDRYYKEARELGNRLAKAGYTVITGGGPGIMEAANRGAHEAGGESIGINIQLPHEQKINKYVNKAMGFHYFFTRKVILSASSQVYVYFPGGFGTLDEFFELVTLIQTKKIEPIPIICYGREYWDKLNTFLTDEAFKVQHAMDKPDLKLFTIVDSVDETLAIIKKSKERKYF